MNIQEVQMNTAKFEAVIEKCSFLGITRESLDICDGNWTIARLLSAIIYWFRPGANGDGRAVKFRDGQYWVYKTAKEWRTEIGLSEWEFRTALDSIEAMGLIERRSMKASNKNKQCVKQLHLSLDKNLLCKMIKDVQATHDYPHAACVSDFPPAPVVTSNQNSSISLVNPPSHPSMSVPQNDSTEGSSPEAKASTNTGGEKPAEELQEEEEIKTSGIDKIETEEKEEIAVQVIAEPLVNGHKVVGIDALWAARTGSPSLTAKQRGQLHGLTKKAGYTAYDTVDWALSHWSEFGGHSVNKGAAKSFPFAPNLDFLVKHFVYAFDLWYRSLWEYKQDEVRKFLIKRGDWWHTVPGLQEKVGVKVGLNGALYVPEPKAPLSHETAWLIYLEAETPEMKAMRGAAQCGFAMAEMAVAKAPHDSAAQADYLTAMKAYDEYGAAEHKALIQLGWDGGTDHADTSIKEEAAGMKLAA